LTTGGHHMRT